MSDCETNWGRYDAQTEEWRAIRAAKVVDYLRENEVLALAETDDASPEVVCELAHHALQNCWQMIQQKEPPYQPVYFNRMAKNVALGQFWLSGLSEDELHEEFTKQNREKRRDYDTWVIDTVFGYYVNRLSEELEVGGRSASEQEAQENQPQYFDQFGWKQSYKRDLDGTIRAMHERKVEQRYDPNYNAAILIMTGYGPTNYPSAELEAKAKILVSKARQRLRKRILDLYDRQDGPKPQKISSVQAEGLQYLLRLTGTNEQSPLEVADLINEEPLDRKRSVTLPPDEAYAERRKRVDSKLAHGLAALYLSEH